MELNIKNIADKNIWEEFFLNCKEKTFLQSWNWGEFQEKMGNKIWRLGIFDNEYPISFILIVKIVAKRGAYLLVQHGPSMIQNSKFKSAVMDIILNELQKIGKEEKTDFIRMAPLFERTKENNEIFKKLGFIKSPMHANAYEATWKLDITLPEDVILKNMRKTTRYLIKQAKKNSAITIEKSENPADAVKYEKLNLEIAKKQKFIPFSFEYIKNEFELFSRGGQALWFFGKYKGEIAAAALVIFWQEIGFYHQAASFSKFAKLSIPYLLQWEIIKEAKIRGCKIYDFWGHTDPEKFPRHPWAGPTLFKMGFGGKAFEYVKTQDYPLSKKYWLIYFFEKLRKIKRGF
ncbi:MAG: peptidoglycan bridge formation glycyltransferase FemA/FemB family protein [Parcubacteria group bacterium]